MEYPVVSLANCCVIKPPKAEARAALEPDDLVSFVPMDSLGINKKVLKLEKTRALADVSGSYTYFAENDVLLAKITPCFENGKLGIATGLTNGIGFGSSEFIVFRPNEHLSSEYLYYFLNQQSFRDAGQAVMTGAVGHKRVPKDFIQATQIPLPPIPEQQRIVAILDQAFADIEKARANAEKNLKNARELFDSYLNQVFSQRGEGWVEKTIDEIAELSRGQNPPKSEFIYEPRNGYIRFYQIRDGKSDKHAVYVPESTKLHYVTKSDILMVAYRHVGGVFRGVEGAFNVALCKIKNRDSTKVNDDYLYNIIPSSFVKGELLKASERSLIPSMSVKHLAGLRIPVPPVEQQEEIVSKINRIQLQCKNLENGYISKMTALDELKKSLLQKAFSGELTKTEGMVA